MNQRPEEHRWADKARRAYWPATQAFDLSSSSHNVSDDSCPLYAEASEKIVKENGTIMGKKKKKDVMSREKQMSVNKFLRLQLLLIPQRLEISSLEIWQFWCAFHWRSCLVESRTTCALKVLFDHPIFHTSKEKLTTNNQYS